MRSVIPAQVKEVETSGKKAVCELYGGQTKLGVVIITTQGRRSCGDESTLIPNVDLEGLLPQKRP